MRTKWHVVVVDADGRRASQTFADEAEASSAKRRLERYYRTLESPVVSDLVVQYREYLDSKGNTKETVHTTAWRLERFLSDVFETDIGRITPKQAQRLYDKAVEGRSADTHRNWLGQVKTFFRWCVKRGFVKTNVFAGVEPVGKRRRGKAQLRIDQSRQFYAAAHQVFAEGGDRGLHRKRGAVAALVALEMGLRAGEILRITAADVDDNGRVLWIPKSKTEAGVRRLEIPEDLRPLLQELAQHAKDGRLFPYTNRRWVRDQVRYICDLAGLPKVSAHALRGTHASIAEEAGATSHLVAAALGHASPTVTRRHYTDESAAQRARQQRALKVIQGGKAC
jgi:integrase